MKKFLIGIALVAVLGFLFILTRPAGKPIDESLYANAPSSTEWGNPEPVEIRGSTVVSPQDPFITPDGQYLLFDDHSEDNKEQVALYYARRIDYKTFEYQGKIEGADAPGTDTVPSLDRDGTLYWGSDRSYPKDFKFAYRGTFANGSVTDIAPVEGISRGKFGWPTPDVHITPDGTTLYISEFKIPDFYANLRIATKNPDGSFAIAPDSDEIFKNINNGGLNYAPDTRDGLELFFSHAKKSDGSLRIYVARRDSLTEPFGPPELIAAAEGKAEAASLAPDGTHLYYHEVVNDRDSRVYVLTRQ